MEEWMKHYDVMDFKYWRLETPCLDPRFQIYTLVGKDKDTGLFWFEKKSNPEAKLFYTIEHLRQQVIYKAFHPFIIPTKAPLQEPSINSEKKGPSKNVPIV